MDDMKKCLHLYLSHIAVISKSDGILRVPSDSGILRVPSDSDTSPLLYNTQCWSYLHFFCLSTNCHRGCKYEVQCRHLCKFDNRVESDNALKLRYEFNCFYHGVIMGWKILINICLCPAKMLIWLHKLQRSFALMTQYSLVLVLTL